jgi:hypothetical protein
LPAGDNAPYAKTIWDSWWRERDALADRILPAATWQLAGLRPANQPQRRLALAARWLAAGDLPARLQAWLSEPPTAGRAFVAQLLATLSGPAEPDDFWAHHWTLRSRRFARAQPLLGAPRVTDLALNVVLPWLHARATIGGHATLLGEIERRYFSWPASEDNAVLKLARDRLFGPAPRALPRTAASQQGLLQLTRDFCDQADARCAGCRFPDLVRALPVQPIHAG